MSRSGSGKKFEFLRPFSKANEKQFFALYQFYIELKSKSNVLPFLSSQLKPKFKCCRILSDPVRSCDICFNLIYSCFQIRCVLCGTVAKSRNSLHSHMSRQHRGISTKVVQIKLKSGRKTNTYLIFLLNLFQDLPVLPMPSPFDAELASK